MDHYIQDEYRSDLPVRDATGPGLEARVGPAEAVRLGAGIGRGGAASPSARAEAAAGPLLLAPHVEHDATEPSLGLGTADPVQPEQTSQPPSGADTDTDADHAFSAFISGADYEAPRAAGDATAGAVDGRTEQAAAMERSRGEAGLPVHGPAANDPVKEPGAAEQPMDVAAPAASGNAGTVDPGAAADPLQANADTAALPAVGPHEGEGNARGEPHIQVGQAAAGGSAELGGEDAGAASGDVMDDGVAHADPAAEAGAEAVEGQAYAEEAAEGQGAQDPGAQEVSRDGSAEQPAEREAFAGAPEGEEQGEQPYDGAGAGDEGAAMDVDAGGADEPQPDYNAQLQMLVGE